MSRPGSSGSNKSSASKKDAPKARPASPPSRPSTPEIAAALDVPMGGVAWIAANGSASTLYTSVGGAKGGEGGAKSGLFTKGMTACFTVIVGGKEGAILSHVSAYLGHATLDKNQKAELAAMNAAFTKLWTKHKFSNKSVQVVIIRGEFTNETQRKALMAQIFPQIAKNPATEFDCEHTPLERNKLHGTAFVKMGASGTEVFLESKRVM